MDALELPHEHRDATGLEDGCEALAESANVAQRAAQRAHDFDGRGNGTRLERLRGRSRRAALRAAHDLRVISKQLHDGGDEVNRGENGVSRRVLFRELMHNARALLHNDYVFIAQQVHEVRHSARGQIRVVLVVDQVAHCILQCSLSVGEVRHCRAHAGGCRGPCVLGRVRKHCGTRETCAGARQLEQSRELRTRRRCFWTSPLRAGRARLARSSCRANTWQEIVSWACPTIK